MFDILLAVALICSTSQGACSTESIATAPIRQAHIANQENLTPADLQLLLGPLVPRTTPAPGWPASFDRNLDSAIRRMVMEVNSNSYTHVTDSPDGDNPHYGPLRMVTMRNIRARLPLDETEPAFRAALKVTREFVRQYAKPAGYDLQAHRNTNWADCEIVYWLYRHDPGDNGVLADECRTYLHVAANWLTHHLTPAQLNLSHQWMDDRIIAIAVELALTADRIGIPWNVATHEKGINEYARKNGARSWSTYVDVFVNDYIDRAQAATIERFGTQRDPNGKPVLFGNIRYGQHGSWRNPQAYREPYPILFFEDAMLANALLRAWRQYGSEASRNNAIELVAGVRQHYDPIRKALPYQSHATGPGRAFFEDDAHYDLNNFWVRPLLEMAELTGDAWMRQTAIDLLYASDRGSWNWRMKQAQQLGSATEPQSAQALLAGVR